MIQFTWFMLGACAACVAFVGIGVWQHAAAKKRRSAQAVAPRALTARRTWEEKFNADGTVLLLLRLTMGDGETEAAGTVGVELPPGRLAKDVKARIIQRRADLVEHCLGWNMRAPEVVALAPPKKTEPTS